MISSTIPYQKLRQRVLGHEMAYVEAGEGNPSCCCMLIPPRRICDATYCQTWSQ
jgi:hypothetical protein